jgi:hypothetical protein
VSRSAMTEPQAVQPPAIEAFEPQLAAEWDELVERAPNGTFLHTRRFLSYHEDRFEDASLVIRRHDGKLIGVLPAAVDPTDKSTVVSHPGATFGGLVHTGRIVGETAVRTLDSIRTRYASLGYRVFRYKAVPWIYHRQPAGDDLYALVRLGAGSAQRNLSCSVDLCSPPRRSERRRRGLRRAQAAGVTLARGGVLASPLWMVIDENLDRRYGARPVHSVEEIVHLHGLFPDRIEFVVAELRGEVVAGVVLFLNSPVTHAQYIAATEAGYGVNALDLVFDECIRGAAEDGYRFFDFGTSNTADGGLNQTLYDFKLGFGGGGVAYESYDITLA